ncbi:uncharacterized protein BP01DRAFT_46098 [Aspergillus saccharolyticus JOP 1030-1]|uniref:Uncharacterized protein n=1 Tax=Aspergillus saccharolyticus JOP 1030-1 TaxID=1450539 RepID=A0A319AED4_9EURO|nr:hypothetical protein BP01DRAFT_46098 [Aspergillus saccharolyticus JOP 1030-1]PYH45212.1 hypothetical protein BP01DRAFT_46098 [Aspergillus saccharolyticus JOP 1030-1]
MNPLASSHCSSSFRASSSWHVFVSRYSCHQHHHSIHQCGFEKEHWMESWLFVIVVISLSHSDYCLLLFSFPMAK